MEDKIVVELPNGTKLIAEKSSDENWPGIYIQLEGTPESDDEVSVPTVLMEFNPENNGVRAFLWADKHSEDYTHKVDFDT